MSSCLKRHPCFGKMASFIHQGEYTQRRRDEEGSKGRLYMQVDGFDCAGARYSCSKTPLKLENARASSWWILVNSTLCPGNDLNHQLSIKQLLKEGCKRPRTTGLTPMIVQ